MKETKACAGQSQTHFVCDRNRKTATEDACDCLSSGVFACAEWNAGYGGQNWYRVGAPLQWPSPESLRLRESSDCYQCCAGQQNVSQSP